MCSRTSSAHSSRLQRASRPCLAQGSRLDHAGSDARRARICRAGDLAQLISLPDGGSLRLNRLHLRSAPSRPGDEVLASEVLCGAPTARAPGATITAASGRRERLVIVGIAIFAGKFTYTAAPGQRSLRLTTGATVSPSDVALRSRMLLRHGFAPSTVSRWVGNPCAGTT